MKPLKYGIPSVSLLILLAGCDTNPGDPVGQPYRLKFQVNQSSTVSNEANLSLLVSYGGFGFIPTVVELMDGITVLATLSEGEILKPTNQDPWDKKFQKDVVLKSDVDYNLSTKTTWTYKGVRKSLTSDVIKFRLTTR